MLLGPEKPALPELDDQLRRSACDRCRCQKLRCERPSGPPDPSSETATRDGSDGGRSSTGVPLVSCLRCQRVGAICTTSFQQRPGRPRLLDSSSLRGAGTRRARAKQVAAQADRADSSHHGRRQCQQRSNAAAAACPSRHDGLRAEEEPCQAAQVQQVTSPRPADGQQSHPSGFSSPIDPFPSPHPRTSEGSRTTPSDEDHSGFWGSCLQCMSPSWDLGGEDFPNLFTTDMEILRMDGTDVPAPASNADPTVVQSMPPDAETHPPQGADWRGLCRQLADLSHALSQDVQYLSSSPPSSSPGAEVGLGHDGASCIQRAFKFLEMLKSLTEDLRMRTRQSLKARSQAEALLTPNSDGRSSSVSTSKETFPPVESSAATEVCPPADHHLDKITTLHIVTAYVCLKQILISTLRSILASVACQQNATGPGPVTPSMGNRRWPDVGVEGLAGDGERFLRMRLLAETCLHVATGIHRRFELLAAAVKKTLGFSLSGPLMMVSGSGSCSCGECDADIRTVRLLCRQVLFFIDEHAW